MPKKQEIFDGTDPLKGFHVNDIDEASSTRYYGFTNKLGNWYVIKHDTSANTLRYAQGVNTNAYATNWTNRTSLSYGYFDVTFKELSL